MPRYLFKDGQGKSLPAGCSEVNPQSSLKVFALSPPTTEEEFQALGHSELVPELAGLHKRSDQTHSPLGGSEMVTGLGVENLKPCLGTGNVKMNQTPSFMFPKWV